MAEQPNFLLGKGKVLPNQSMCQKTTGSKKRPYTFDEARDHVVAVCESRQ